MAEAGRPLAGTPLAGKLALVTGAGMGIGQGIALELARQGADVVVHYAGSEQGARDTVAQIQGLGRRSAAVQGRLGDIDACRRVVGEAVSALGGLDILINNAGVTRALDFLDTTPEIYNEVFDLNMRGYFFCAQEAVRSMLTRGGGAIVNITSVHGGGGFPRHAAYAGTKGAIIAFTRTLAIELASRHVRVNAVAPGVVEVPRYFDIPDYTREFGDSMVPWGRVGTPGDIGNVVAFLASDAADWVTGQTLYVDGGTNARMGLWWDQGDKAQ
ncbi:MAG: 3-oxoacyl-ACP reductase FabG [Chloroflexi bacterium]|nr:3-oxoacyl-ACP reductase FabG [Chloroflexota bacterium]